MSRSVDSRERVHVPPGRSPAEGGAVVAAPSRRRRRRSGHGLVALAFLSPLFLMYAVYFAYSFWFLVTTSFKRVDISFANAASVGWQNYRLLLADPAFRRAILNNLLFAATTIIVALTLAFFIAVALSAGVRARRLYYLIFLVPTLMPVALVATIFGVMLEFQNGALNTALRSIGLGALAQQWLLQPTWAVASIISLFAYLIGLPIMYYTADLASISTAPIEAALLDGAGPLRIMRSVLYPMMRSTHITVIISLLLTSFRAFEVSLFTTNGGPGDSTEIVGLYIYNFVTSSNSTIGYAAAASVIVLVIAFIISAGQLTITRYLGEGRDAR